MTSALIVLALLHSQSKGDGGILYGPGAAFTLEAPKGWVLDNRAGQKDGLFAVFYPKGSSWSDAKTVMYAKTEERKGRTLTSYLAEDHKQFLKQDPHYQIVRLSALFTADHKKATLLRYDSKTLHQHDIVAFVEFPKAFGVITVSSREADGITHNRKAFESLVKTAGTMIATVGK